MRVRVRGDIHKTCYENLIKLSCCRHRDMVVGALKIVFEEASNLGNKELKSI